MKHVFEIFKFKSRINPYNATIQLKASEQCFHVVLFIMMYKEVLTFNSVAKTIQMKAGELYFHVVLQLFVFESFHKSIFFWQLKYFETLGRKEFSCSLQRFHGLFTCFH